MLRAPVVVTLSADEAAALSRQLDDAIERGWGVRRAAPPYVLLEFAITVRKQVHATRGTARPGYTAGQGATPEPRNSRSAGGAGVSGQPARAVSVRDAARAAACSESYVRRLVRDGTLEVRESQGPGYEIYADSLAAWLERRRRKERDPKAA